LVSDENVQETSAKRSAAISDQDDDDNDDHSSKRCTVLFPLMGIEIGMEIIYFHSEK